MQPWIVNAAAAAAIRAARATVGSTHRAAGGPTNLMACGAALLRKAG